MASPENGDRLTNRKRYDLELEETGGDARIMAPDENGEWVKWEDYERLRALFHEITELTCTEHDCTPCRRIDEVAERALSGSSEPGALPLCDGEVRVIYQHGEPTGVRDTSGYLCHFNRVPKWPGQEDRYRNELALRARQAEAIATALRT